MSTSLTAGGASERQKGILLFLPEKRQRQPNFQFGERHPSAASDGSSRPSPLRRRDHVCRQSRTNTPPSLSARYRSLLRRLRKGEQILDRRRHGACAVDSEQAARNRALPVAYGCGRRAGWSSSLQARYRARLRRFKVKEGLA